jgi:hypothetical protein
MRDLLKVALFAAVIWGADSWSIASKKSEDFFACNAQAAGAISEQGRNASIAFLLPPNLSAHDQVDELIQRCMLSKGYDYAVEGWSRCPVEKLPACYNKPSWFTQGYRIAREVLHK